MHLTRNPLMRARPLLTRLAALLGAATLLAACAGTALHPAKVDRMYVFDCGTNHTGDLSRWSPGAHMGEAATFSDNCYLIRHGGDWMLWDSGLSDAIAHMPNGQTSAGGAINARVSKTLLSQLTEIGVKPEDIHYLAFSHTHSDHVGNANYFTHATLYIQEAEYNAAFGPDAAKLGFNPALYDKLRASPVKKLHGDFDVFGDGSVTIISTPGHTPGHQSLLVRLPKRGAVLLSGDMVHFRENWDMGRVPAANYDKEASVRSMQKAAQVMAANHAQLWINHDAAQSATIPKAPRYVE
ncbi:MAG TPA: N-acyl homoserine lactonase family protein [Burkholderiales bacterium]